MPRVYLCDWEDYTDPSGEPARRPVTPADAKWAASDLGDKALVVTPENAAWPLDVRRIPLGNPNARPSRAARQALESVSAKTAGFPPGEDLGDLMLRVLKRAGALPGRDGRLRAHYNGVEVHSRPDADVDEVRDAKPPPSSGRLARRDRL